MFSSPSFPALLSWLVDSLQALDPWAGQILTLMGRQMLYAAVVALVVALPAWGLRRRAPALSHGLWSLVLMRLVLPPDVASSLSLRALWQRLLPADLPHSPLPMSPAGALEALPWPTTVLSDTSTALASGPVWSSLAVLLWLQLAVLVFAWGCWQRRRYARLLQTQVADPEILQRLQIWRRRLGLRRSVELWTGPTDHMPFTLGLLRPRIFLPGRLLESPSEGDAAARQERLDAVLGHELAHIVHGDDAWLQGQRLLMALYLFFPPLWWACSRMHEARERLADTLTLRTGLVSPRNYALALLHVHQQQLTRPWAVSAFGPDSRRLVLRIRTILDHDAPAIPSAAEGAQPIHLLRRGLPWALLVGLVLLPMAAVHNASGDGAGGESPSSVANSALANSVDAEDPPRAADGETIETKAPIQFVHPLPSARQTAAFGPWKSPFKDHPDHHNGLDLASPRGTLIVAPADGVVTAASTDPSKTGDYGVVLYLEHGSELETVYAHLDNVLVDEGDRVEAGQPIATVGMTGKTTGPHLHFEVRRGGELVDPASLLDDDC